ncbi:hypothetical protein FS749_008750 [Ceratobasidium sp. UAMH 11750]|nr:hypothetical protein FS749_008750 [Ceratobasidium sp. UAMH 11750]
MRPERPGIDSHLAPSSADSWNIEQEIALIMRGEAGEAGGGGYSDGKYTTQDFGWETADWDPYHRLVEEPVEHSARVVHPTFY